MIISSCTTQPGNFVWAHKRKKLYSIATAVELRQAKIIDIPVLDGQPVETGRTAPFLPAKRLHKGHIRSQDNQLLRFCEK
jgi:hypothetical protein